MKRSRWMLSSVSAFLLLTTTHTTEADAQSSEAWMNQVLGSYQSQIMGADELLDGVTKFRQTDDGTLAGYYTMNEQGVIVPGALSQCQAVQTRVMRCIWNDKYGTGDLEVSFSEDFSKFEGRWGDKGSEPTYEWNGAR